MKVGILTSGGDSPGMNSCLRACARTLLFNQSTPVGIERGYSGLFEKSFLPLNASSVGNIIQRGGTILKSSRCKEFFEADQRAIAVKNLKDEGIEGLIVIGGDGSFKGAMSLWEEHKFPVIGVPGTIDNDISGTEYTIGHDSAIRTAVEAVDKVRDTAASHDRVFFIEVMGRNSSALALSVGVSTGAENVILPNRPVPYQEITQSIERGIARGKTSSIFIVAEGDVPGRSYQIQKHLDDQFKIQSHVCILGHIQRGGAPSATDRLISSQMGHLAGEEILKFKRPMACVVKHGRVRTTDLQDCLVKTDSDTQSLLELTQQLSI